VQFVELNCWGCIGELVQLEPMESLGARTSLYEDATDRAGVDIADLGCGLN
jgi:hypothetical protein